MFDAIDSIDAQELQTRLAKGAEDFVLLDCREADELRVASIPGALHIAMQTLPARLHELDRSKEYAILCHHGVRSSMVCRFLAQQGFGRVVNVSGGIDAYARRVDPTVGTY